MVCRNVRIRTDQLQGTRGIETSSSYSKFDGGGGGGGLSQCMGRAQGALNAVKKYLIVKLLAISLQAYKLTKNVLLHTYFSRILARF